jgi:hypothetical protein
MAATAFSPVSAEERQRAVRVLRQTLMEGNGWTKVYAAESLLALDLLSNVASVFQQELESHTTDGEYRIGIWSVLYRATYDDGQREQWINFRPFSKETKAKRRLPPRLSANSDIRRAARLPWPWKRRQGMGPAH